MVFLAFLLGLCVGLAVLGCYYIRLNNKLKRLIQNLKPDVLKLAFSPTSRLTRAIAAYGDDYQNLKQQLETWRQIGQAAPIGFLQVDQENQLVWCNPKACEIFHLQSYQVQSPRLLLELVRSYELDQLVEQTRAQGNSCQWEWTFHPVFADPSILAQQASYPLRALGVPLSNGHVAVFLENRQESVSMAQQRDRWISDVAHELKTPLTSIRLVAETLQMRLEPPLRAWIDRLLKETIRLSNLVQDLLDLSQLEARPTPALNLRTVDLVKLIQSAWFGLEPLARLKQIQLDYKGPSDLLFQADESRFHRALLNLLDNSIKYSPPQKTIQIQVKTIPATGLGEPPQIYLEVVDFGPGFPEAALPYVFDRFYRVDPSRARNQVVVEPAKTHPTEPPGQGSARSDDPPMQPDAQTLQAASSGSGLGLAIVRQIVEAHGGIVKASNHPQTQGAWLQIFLPVQN